MNESLKNMLTSVDWKKLMSSSDAKNALIGSALGGLMLGGASALSKRDPEESKLAPVGDALMGAVLGGVAGYGIPKGLAMFRDAGSMAPDTDKLRTNYLGWGLGGGAAGVGLVGASLAKTLGRAADEAGADASKSRLGSILLRAKEMNTNPTPENVRAWNAINFDPKAYHSDRAALRRGIISSLARGKGKEAWKNMKEFQRITGLHNAHTRGYTSLSALLGRASGEALPGGKPVTGIVNALLHPKRYAKNFSHGSHYAPGSIMGLTRAVGPTARLALRAGKVGLAGAGLGMLAHKLIGPSASNNFKN